MKIPFLPKRKKSDSIPSPKKRKQRVPPSFESSKQRQRDYIKRLRERL